MIRQKLTKETVEASVNQWKGRKQVLTNEKKSCVNQWKGKQKVLTNEKVESKC